MNHRAIDFAEKWEKMVWIFSAEESITSQPFSMDDHVDPDWMPHDRLLLLSYLKNLRSPWLQKFLLLLALGVGGKSKAHVIVLMVNCSGQTVWHTLLSITSSYCRAYTSKGSGAKNISRRHPSTY
jgi:hypothetical protein